MWFVFSRSFDIYSCSDVVGQSDLAMITSYKMPFGFSMEIPYTEEQWKLKLRRQARKGEAGVT